MAGDRGTLLCPVKSLELAEELPGDVTLQAAFHLPHRLALGVAASGVRLGLRVLTEPDKDDGVQRPVELAVAHSAEPMPDRQTRRGWEWRDAGELGEGGLADEAALV